MAKFLGEGTVQDKLITKENYTFQNAKEHIHAVSLPPLPVEKLKAQKSAKNGNTGIVKVLNFNLKIFDVKEKLLRLRTQNEETANSILGLSINKSENNESSFINSELHRKIVAIKKKSGAKVFHVKRYEGEPTMNPRDVKREIVDPPGLPAPKPIYPLFTTSNPQHRPEADHQIEDSANNESYDISS